MQIRDQLRDQLAPYKNVPKATLLEALNAV
jgi:hypothetical protein